MDQWTTVIPEPGTIEATAGELLALADDPAHVMTQRGGAEFRIPPYLAARYHAPAKILAPRRRSSKDGEK